MSNSNDPWDGYRGPSLGGEKVGHGFRNVGEVVAAWIDFCDDYPLTAFFGDAEEEQDYPDARHYMTAERILQQDNLGQEFATLPDPNTDREQHIKRAAVVTSLALKLVQSEQQLFRKMGVQTEWWEHLSERFGVTRDKSNTKGNAESQAESFNYGCDPDDTEELFRELADPDPAADMLPAVRLLIKHLQSIGKEGQRLARLIEENSEDRSAQWGIFELKQHKGKWQPDPKIRYWIATALWEDVVKPPLERRANFILPAITEATSDLIIQISQPGVVLNPNGHPVRPKGVEPREIANITVPQIGEVDVQALQTNTQHFWLAVLAEITYAFERYVSTGEFSNEIQLDGGWKQLIDLVNTTLDWNLSGSSDTQKSIKRAVLAQAHLVFKIGNWEGNLLLYKYNTKTHELKLTLGDMLLPRFNQIFGPARKLSNNQRKWVNLVPVTKPASLEHFRAADRGSALSFQHVLITEARRKCEDILDGKGIYLPPLDLKALAAKAHFPTPEKALDVWTKDGDDSPALLERVGQYHYTIADNPRFGPARKLIEQHAKKKRGNRERQRKKRERDNNSKRPTPEGDAG